MLDLFFIAVLKLGVGGAAFATVIAQITSALLLLIRLVRTKEVYGIRPGKIRIDTAMALCIIQIGLPTGLQNCAHALSNVVIQSYINGYGSDAMAGIGAYVKAEGFALLPLSSFAMALTTYVSQNLGAKKKDRVNTGVHFGIVAGILMTQLIGVVLFAFAPQIVGLFNSDLAVIVYDVGRARVATVFFFVFAYTQLMTAILRGCSHAAEPMAVFVVCWCLMRILIMAIGSRFITSVALTYWVYPITWAMSSITLFFIWRKVKASL